MWIHYSPIRPAHSLWYTDTNMLHEPWPITRWFSSGIITHLYSISADYNGSRGKGARAASSITRCFWVSRVLVPAVPQQSDWPRGPGPSGGVEAAPAERGCCGRSLLGLYLETSSVTTYVQWNVRDATFTPVTDELWLVCECSDWTASDKGVKL